MIKFDDHKDHHFKGSLKDEQEFTRDGSGGWAFQAEETGRPKIATH